MTAARKRTKAMASAAARYHGEEVESIYRYKLEYDAGELAVMLDDYFANTRFHDGTGRTVRLKPEAVDGE